MACISWWVFIFIQGRVKHATLACIISLPLQPVREIEEPSCRRINISGPNYLTLPVMVKCILFAHNFTRDVN
jgi:hypothetical protein